MTMGRIGKTTTTTIKGQSDKDTNKECVSEDTISKLMKDFTCASLLTKATQDTVKDKKSSMKEAHTHCCEEIVSSLKHFHLKTPVNKRTRRKEKKDLQRKAKSALENKYNLSIAAIHTQTSVVWPGKLNGLPNKRTDSSENFIIRPSRLSIHGITDTNISKPPGTSSLSSPIQTSSSEEKARIATALNGRSIPCFGDMKGKNGSSNLSFSQLCNRGSKDSSACNFLSNSPALPASVKTEAYRQGPAAMQKGKNSINYNHSCNPLQISRLGEHSSESGNIPDINSSQQQQQQRTLPHSGYSYNYSSSSSQSFDADDVNNNVVGSVSTANQSSLPKSASASSITPERSCSEEMRMEESNVNELASYFDDLLYIPRKMSVMAEMMYA